MVQEDLVPLAIEFLQQEFNLSTLEEDKEKINFGVCHALSLLRIYASLIDEEPNPENKKRDDSVWLERMEELLKRWSRMQVVKKQDRPFWEDEQVSAKNIQELHRFIQILLAIQELNLVLPSINQAHLSIIMEDTKNRQFVVESSYYVATQGKNLAWTLDYLTQCATRLMAKDREGSGRFWVDFGSHSCCILRQPAPDGGFLYYYRDPSDPSGKVRSPKRLAELLLQTATDNELLASAVGIYELNHVHKIKPRVGCCEFFGSKKDLPYFLLKAAANNDLPAVDSLLTWKVNMEQPDERGRRPVWVAAALGHFVVVDKLISTGANPSATDEKGFTPLIMAAFYGQAKVAKILAPVVGSQINYQEPSGGTTALHQAVWAESLDVVKILLENNAAINIVDNKNKTPLQLAIDTDQPEIARLLAQREAELLLIKAIKNNDLAVATNLLTWRSNIDKNKMLADDKSYIFLAAECGHADMVALLLKHHFPGANVPNKQGETPLSIATQKGHTAVAMLLLKQQKLERQSKPSASASSKSTLSHYAERSRTARKKQPAKAKQEKKSTKRSSPRR